MNTTIFNKYLSNIDKNILTINLHCDIVRIQKANRISCREVQATDCNITPTAPKKGTEMNRQNLTKGTKYFLDFMFYAGILITVSLPLSIKWIGEYIEGISAHYGELVIIYFVLGIAALVIIRELRRIFSTVLKGDCFVEENVRSLHKMSNWSFFIVVMSVVRSIVYLTIAMLVVILVFTIAGLFSKVLAFVFEEAIRYKEENDLTI